MRERLIKLEKGESGGDSGGEMDAPRTGELEDSSIIAGPKRGSGRSEPSPDWN